MALNAPRRHLGQTRPSGLRDSEERAFILCKGRQPREQSRQCTAGSFTAGSRQGVKSTLMTTTTKTPCFIITEISCPFSALLVSTYLWSKKGSQIQDQNIFFWWWTNPSRHRNLPIQNFPSIYLWLPINKYFVVKLSTLLSGAGHYQTA